MFFIFNAPHSIAYPLRYIFLYSDWKLSAKAMLEFNFFFRFTSDWAFMYQTLETVFSLLINKLFRNEILVIVGLRKDNRIVSSGHSVMNNNTKSLAAIDLTILNNRKTSQTELRGNF